MYYIVSLLRKNAKIIAIILTVVFAITSVMTIGADTSVAMNNPSSAPETVPELIVAAEKESIAGVEWDSGFIISSSESIRKNTMKNRLSIVPAVKYELRQRTDNELYIKINGKLEADTVYNILISDNDFEPPKSWAFQTRSSFRIKGTFPANGGKHVPVQSGIELYFSQPVDDIGKSVTINPALEGSFKQFDDKTVVFVLSDSMKYDTVYTVTISDDIQSRDGDALPEEYSFSFKTENSSTYGGQRPLYPYDGISETFTSTDPIFIKLYVNNNISYKEMNVAIYRYPGLDDYMTALHKSLQNDDDLLPTEGLEKITEYKDNLLMNTELYWNIAFLPVPENPGPGWYLVDIQSLGGAHHAQKLIQITDIAVYSQTANGQMLFWLNDADSGKPISKANISVDGKKARSDKNGLALLNIPVRETDKRDTDDDDYYYYYRYCPPDSLHLKKEVRIKYGNQRYGEYLDFYGEKEIPLNKLYYTYVYTDREAYLPNDTVHFWGAILPRTSNSARPGRIVLDWTDGGKYPDGIEIAVQQDGTFRGEIKLEKHVSGWEPLEFTLKGRTLMRSYLTIMEYIKPTYMVDVTLDKNYYRKDDTVIASINSSFYDGTPARDIELSISYNTGNRYSGFGGRQLKTDKNGKVQADFSPPGDVSWHPRHDYINGKTTGAEDQTVYIYQPILVFPSDYMFLSSTERTDGGFLLNVESFEIDFDKADKGEYDYGDDQKLCGARADMEGSGVVYQVEYVKTKTGEYYDFVNKVTVDRYKFDRRETIMETFSFQTKNGKFKSQQFDYPKKEHTYYFIELNCTTPDGQRLEEKCYVKGYQEYYDRYADKNYTSYFFKQNNSEKSFNDYDYYYYYDYNSSSSGGYGLDEKIEMYLSDQNEQVPEQGRVLYTVLGRKLFSYTTVKSSYFSLKYKAEYAPNAIVVGAYFDGKHIFSVSSSSLIYRYEDSKLIIDVKPDKERYKPGDEVTLRLRITDQNGRNKSANYLLSVVDEAAFAIREQNIDPLRDIYKWSYIDYCQYVSYIQPYEIESAAEQGEGGGDSVRREFVDTVAFLRGKTDANGRATIKFKLADNITSWRLTSIAFCDRMVDGVNIPRVGKDVSNIESGLSFFINEVLNEKYLDGDSVGLSLRGAGSAIESGDAVDYEVSLSGDDVEKQKTAQGPADDYCLVDFGKLPIGKYKVLIRASYGGFKDAIEKEIEVVDSLLLTSRCVIGDLEQGINISAKRFPVNITFYDTDNKLYYDIIYQLLYANGDRSDQKIVRAMAGKRLNEINADTKYSETLDLDGDEAYSWSEGLRLFPYAETDVLLTAKAAAVASEFMDEAALAEYFLGVIQSDESTAVDVAAAYMGLGALKEPVLPDLRKKFEEAKSRKNSTLEEKLYLAAGLALLGDNDSVRDWYEEEIHNELTLERNMLCYEKNSNHHNNYRLTAEAAMLACLIGHPDHQLLLMYLTTHHSSTYTPLLELATYIGEYSPKPGSPAVFSYKLAGKTIRHAFDKKPCLNLELGETQLAEADFKVLDGNVSYSAQYYGGLDEAEKALPEGVGLNVNPGSKSVTLGDTIYVKTTMTFDDKAPVGYYHVSQIVPSGFRFVRINDQGSYDKNWYCRVGESGMLDFYICPLRGYRSTFDYNNTTMPKSVTFTYTIRAVLPGSYIMEAPTIVYSGSNYIYAGDRNRLDVVE